MGGESGRVKEVMSKHTGIWPPRGFQHTLSSTWPNPETHAGTKNTRKDKESQVKIQKENKQLSDECK